MRPISCGVPRSGSIALVKVVANSMPIMPKAKASITSQMLKSPGAANHSSHAPTTYMAENSQMNPIRPPDLSATAPSKGERMAITTPVAPMP